MKNPCWLLAVICAWVPAFAHSEGDVFEKVFNKVSWQSFNWAAVESSALWNSQQFQDAPDSSDAYNTRSFARGKLGNKTVTIMRRVHRKNEAPKYSFVYSYEDRLACEVISERNRSSFGEEISQHDESYTLQGQEVVRKILFWKVGNTAIVQECNEYFGGDMTVFVNFFEIDMRFIPSDAIHLTCSREMELAEYPGSYDPGASLSLSVYPYTKKVVNELGDILAMDAILTGKKIQFSMKNEASEANYIISRETGRLEAEVKRKDRPGAVFARLRGECAVRTKNANKF